MLIVPPSYPVFPTRGKVSIRWRGSEGKNAGSSERKIKHWIPDQVGDDTKGKNRNDEIPR